MKKLFSTLFVLSLLFFTVTSSAIAATMTVNDTSDVVDSNPGDGYCDTDTTLDNTPCTLRAAIQETNALEGTNTITLPEGTYSLSLVMTDENGDGMISETDDDTQATGDLDIQNNLTITGEGASTTIIDAEELLDCTHDINDRVMQVHSGYMVALSGINIEQGGSQSSSASCTKDKASFNYGGGIYNSGTLSLISVILGHNKSDLSGGGIYNNGTLTIADSMIAGNESESGAGIYNDQGTLTITGTMIAGNTAEETGGGIVNISGTLTLSENTIYRNIASAGGGISSFGGTTTMTDTTVSENASYFGGGLICASSTIEAVNSTFSSNYVVAVVHDDDEEVLCNDGIDNDSDGNADSDDDACSSTYNGGETDSECTDSTDNDGDGGTDASDLDCMLGSGGAITDYTVPGVDMPCTVTLTNSTLSGNRADSRGGAINSSQSTFNLNNVTITDNGGAVQLSEETTISESDYGGGIHVYGGSVTLRNSILAGNAGTGSPDCYGAVTSNDYNIVGNQLGCTFTASLNDQVGDSGGSGILDPQLDSLANNGGSTYTHALQTDSTAIDAGNESGCTDGISTLTTDQRGEERHQDSTDNNVCTERCDIGAYEAEGTNPACTTTEDCDNETDDDDDGLADCDDTDCSADPACEEPPVEDCDNGTDDDDDGMIDCDDPDCATDSACAETYIPPEDCDNGIDDDLDGAADCDDTDCASDPSCEDNKTISGDDCVAEGGSVVDASRLELDARDAIRLSNGRSIDVEIDGVTYTVSPIETRNDEGAMTTSISISSQNAVTGGTACLTTDDQFKLTAGGGGCACNLDGDRPPAKEFYSQLFILAFLALLPLMALLRVRRQLYRY